MAQADHIGATFYKQINAIFQGGTEAHNRRKGIQICKFIPVTQSYPSILPVHQQPTPFVKLRAPALAHLVFPTALELHSPRWALTNRVPYGNFPSFPLSLLLSCSQNDIMMQKPQITPDFVQDEGEPRRTPYL